MTITPAQNRRLHQLLNETGMMAEKAALVQKYSQNEATSSKDLSIDEAKALITHLQSSIGHRDQIELKRMRGKAIHYLCLMGYVDTNGKADFGRINNFIKQIGSRNPRKVILNYLYRQELMDVLSQVEAMYRHEIRSK